MGKHTTKRKDVRISEEAWEKLAFIAKEKGQTNKKVIETLIDISYRVYQPPVVKK